MKARGILVKLAAMLAGLKVKARSYSATPTGGSGCISNGRDAFMAVSAPRTR